LYYEYVEPKERKRVELETLPISDMFGKVHLIQHVCRTQSSILKLKFKPNTGIGLTVSKLKEYKLDMEE
jgi:hypothetical protein